MVQKRKRHGERAGAFCRGGEEILELGILRTVMETEADTLTSGASCSVFSGCGFLGLAEDQQWPPLSEYSLPPPLSLECLQSLPAHFTYTASPKGLFLIS